LTELHSVNSCGLYHC